MSRSPNPKPNNSTWKTPLIIVGIFVCFASMFTISGQPSRLSLQKANGLVQNMPVNVRPATFVNSGPPKKIHQKSSKPHYDFLSYYFMVEADRKKPSMHSFQEDRGVARRFAMIPKLLFNSLFGQN